MQPQKEQTNATPTSDPISTSGACSDSKPATPARSGQLPNTHFKKPPLHNQDEFGPLGKGLMALSMTHVSPTKLNAHADSASSEQQSSASTTVASPMRDVTVRPNRGSHAPAVSSSQAGSILSPDATMQHAASSSGAPPKRNIYPELIEDNDDPHSWTVSSQPMYSNADRGSCVAQTSEHGGAAWQQNGDVSSESYSSHEVYAHQYGEQGGTAQQRSNAAWVPSMQSMPHGYAGQHYQYSQSFTVGQVSSVRQDSDQQLPATQPILSGQGSRAPFRASQFHPLGTTPLHDGQLIQQPQQQHMQQVQHVSNGFGHNSSQPYAQQQGDALMAIPAWRLMGTSPLQDGNVFYNGTAAEQPISSAAQPLTYASMAVKSWSTQVKNPLVSHRTSHHDGAQVMIRHEHVMNLLLSQY